MTKKEIKQIKYRALKDIVKEALATINGEDNLTNAEKIYGQVLINRALQGDLKSAELLMKYSGESEPEKVEINANVGITHNDAIELIKQQLGDV